MGTAEVDHWLNEAQTFIKSHETLDTDLEVTQMGLEQHQAFFSRLVHYKLLLDDKWKVFESMTRASPSRTDSQQIEEGQQATRQKLQDLTLRMDQISQDSSHWEDRLKEGIQRWRSYQESLRLITHWLHRAESLLSEKNSNTQQALEAHSAFFSTADDRLVTVLQKSAQELQQWLPDERRRLTVAEAVDSTVAHWKRVMSQAPQQKMKLEFRLNQESFALVARDVERQLSIEQQALSLPSTVTDQLLKQHVTWFVTPGPAVSQARMLLERLEETAAALPSDPDVQQGYQSVRNQWDALIQRSDIIQGQLEAIPEKWNEYLTKYDDMIQWMSSVDQSVAQMSEDAGSLANYDRLRVQFQAVCTDVDSRREGMKWLVQRLDSLLSYKTPEEGEEAQRKLEELISRYKNLVAVIESNSSKTDLLSKCYGCREEIQKVCSTLDGIQEQMAKADSSNDGGDLDILDSDTLKQETLVKQLDGQRAAIVSLLQRGRDLQHHSNAPGFLTEEVHQLEITWNKTYEMANEKLKKLKGNKMN